MMNEPLRTVLAATLSTPDYCINDISVLFPEPC